MKIVIGKETEIYRLSRSPYFKARPGGRPSLGFELCLERIC